METTFSERCLSFYKQLKNPLNLPEGIEVLNPYLTQEAMEACYRFYNKYYNDTNGRTLILGINPGRFGAGVTGIPFTDPVQLEESCGISNSFAKRGELSSEFIYKLIKKFGGPEKFYSQYYIGAVSPLGFTKDGKNFNYYDTKELTRSLKPFILRKLVKQIGLGVTSRTCFVLGQGKNLDYLKQLNDEMKLFDELIPIPHPRWVMQYRRKQLDNILSETVELLEGIHHNR